MGGHAGAMTGDGMAKIGPNAVTQLIAALDESGLGQIAEPLFKTAGVFDWLEHPPEIMIDEIGVGRLHRTLRSSLPPDRAEDLMRGAGRRTADYLLRVRIPKPAQMVLKALPPLWSARLLVRAITSHAWTFAGSGRFSARAGNPTVFELVGNPLCAGETYAAPACAWHAAVFERLFQVLVSANCRAIETECEARGDPRCRFELRW